MARSHGHSAYVYARDAANALEAREVLAAEAARTRAFEIVPAAELERVGVDPQAWFALVAKPGHVLAAALLPPALRPATPRSVAGVLRTDAAADAAATVGFVAWGRGIRSGLRMPTVDLVDVAPTIASLLGLRLDDRAEGRAMIGILRASVEPPPAGPRRLGGDRDRRLREVREAREGDPGWR